MEFRILGSVEVVDERTGLCTVPTGAKQRALLGALVVRAGQVVPAHRLVEELWGQAPPVNAGNALQAHVARLRRLLPVPAPGSGEPHHEWIVTGPMGYVLRLGQATTDAQRFHQLAARGRALLDGDPRHAVRTLRRALALWRGPALEAAGTGGICAAEVARLEEQRLTALETLYAACLRAGEHERITAELAELTADHPLRERFYDLLMTALYLGGRQAEALCVYDRARRSLLAELGVEPGPALRARLEAILHHDPALDRPPGAAAHGGRTASVHPLSFPAPLPAAEGPGTPAPADADTAGSGHAAVVRELRGEIALLRSHVERLSREQEELVHRLNRLTGTSRLPRAAGR